MEFGDYIIFVDESGDHGLQSIDSEYPIFCLAFCIFKKEEYSRIVVPSFTEFKFKWFGHDSFILHESDIVKKRSHFSFLQYDNLRNRFMSDLSDLIANIPMTVISSIIRKDKLIRRYTSPENPYQLSLLFCLEKAHLLLEERNSSEKLCHIICESRSPRGKAGRGREDLELELEFHRICSAKHYLQSYDDIPMREFDIHFVAKQANSCGLQIADLIARPIGLSILHPEQPNRAFEIISEKFWRGLPHGVKIFP